MIKSQIVSNAGKIWQYLDKKGEAPISEIEEQLNLKEQEVCLALGWMAYDNRIFLVQDEQNLSAVIFD